MKNIQFIAEILIEYRNIIEGLLIATLVITALINDIKYYKIPNRLNAMFIIIGLIFNLSMGSVRNSFVGMLVPLVLFPLFALRMIGAGDIKLFCAIGAVVCFPHIVSIMVYSIIFNGIIAVIIMIIRKNTNGFLRLWQWLKFILISGMIMEYQTLEKSNNNLFRYAYGITLGCLYYVVTDLLMGGRYALL